MNENKINIIGAGLSGLVAAKLLEEYGFNPVIWEASDRVGGRMKTDLVNGYQLDRGFQVLLDQYPALKKYLDYDSLDLQKLLPGAEILMNGKQFAFGDPVRSFSNFWASAFSPVASLGDLFKLYQLRNSLSDAKLSDHFSEEGENSLAYLRRLGFSEKVIQHFFKPFFSGIFLENELATSASMMRFVYALFSKGNAVIPKAGIEAAPKQIAAQLKRTTIHFNTKIDQLQGKTMQIRGVDEITSDFFIVACDPSQLLSQLPDDSVLWNSLDTFYYEVDRNVFGKAIIGLDSDDHLVNHLFYPQSVDTASKGEKEVISVNVVNVEGKALDSIEEHLEGYLRNKLNLKESNLIKHYHLKKALPRFERMQYDISEKESQLSEHIYLVGDHQVNPSQNAAILSAEAAVSAIVEKQLQLT